MRISLLFVLVLLMTTPVFAQLATDSFRIAFGSCANQESELPIYDVVVKHQPNLFVLLGDNIYGDTRDYEKLVSIYKRMGDKPTYKNLKAHVPIIATWDDHDYGENDAGRHFYFKEESKKAFLDFFDEPINSPRRTREGVYDAYMYEFNGKRIQVILLDVRTFRDNLKPYGGEKWWNPRFWYKKRYSPYLTEDSTMLGAAQWSWLEEELRKPADVRIIGSGSQFGITWNGYESWANFPKERERMFNLIKQTKAEGVVFISGDVHYAELSKMNVPGIYPMYDVTASGLSSTWEFATPNKNRVKGPVMQNHFGMITLVPKGADMELVMEVWDVTDKRCFQQKVLLSQLIFITKSANKH